MAQDEFTLTESQIRRIGRALRFVERGPWPPAQQGGDGHTTDGATPSIRMSALQITGAISGGLYPATQQYCSVPHTQTFANFGSGSQDAWVLLLPSRGSVELNDIVMGMYVGDNTDGLAVFAACDFVPGDAGATILSSSTTTYAVTQADDGRPIVVTNPAGTTITVATGSLTTGFVLIIIAALGPATVSPTPANVTGNGTTFATYVVQIGSSSTFIYSVVNLTLYLAPGYVAGTVVKITTATYTITQANYAQIIIIAGVNINQTITLSTAVSLGPNFFCWLYNANPAPDIVTVAPNPFDTLQGGAPGAAAVLQPGAGLPVFGNGNHDFWGGGSFVAPPVLSQGVGIAISGTAPFLTIGLAALIAQATSIEVTDGGTGTLVYPVIVSHESTGTPGPGFGVGIISKIKDSTTNDQPAFDIQSTWLSAIHGATTSRTTLNVYDTAIREAIRMEANGTAAQLGFFGHATTAQPTGDVAAGLNALGLMAGATVSATSAGSFSTGSGTTTTGNTTLFDVANAHGIIHSGCSLHNTDGANTLSYTITGKDMAGTIGTSAGTIAVGAWGNFTFSSAIGIAKGPPYQELKITVTDGVSGSHATYSWYFPYIVTP